MASYSVPGPGAAIRFTKSAPDSEADASSVSGDEVGMRTLNDFEPHRPVPLPSFSAPVYPSPARQHRRTPSKHGPVKETPNARSSYQSSQDDGPAQRTINQYTIGKEIGRGSFGAVHLAVDQYDNQYAVKEFSKSRLRRRAKSNLLRGPRPGKRPGYLNAPGFNLPMYLRSPMITGRSDDGTPESSLDLIQQEIAIMKKLHHQNLVSLIEALDDPEEDSLYMVLELCKKGVIMDVGIGSKAIPYEPEVCRCWFRDLILGVEYLHAQGIAHRDIKPDNLLITDDEVLKIVDFGVSEMFEKESDMMSAKSAGSPAFLPPELCVVKHGDVSGKAADIWSMGVTLYCLRFGCVPFEEEGVLEMYEAIRTNELDRAKIEREDPEFVDLITRILDKDPSRRIKMDEIREHPWVTLNGSDPLLSKEENVQTLVEPPTEKEIKHAITHNIGKLVSVIKACNKFKKLLEKGISPKKDKSLFHDESRFVQPPEPIREQKRHTQHEEEQ